MVGVTIRRRRLAAELRRIREAARLTIEQVASASGVSKSALSRIENSVTKPSIPVLKALIEVYQVESVESERLLQLARDVDRREWWQSYTDVTNDRFVTYISLEAAATSIRHYEQILIPGLFQTADYATAVISGLAATPSVPVDRLVKLRLARQAQLDTLEYWAILEENCLRRQVCQSAAHIEQLEHVLELSRRPNIRIQIIPREIPVHVGLDGPFLILKFDDPKDPEIVYIESMGGQLLLDREDDAKRLGAVFDHLRATALNFDSSRERIEDVIGEIKEDGRTSR